MVEWKPSPTATASSRRRALSSHQTGSSRGSRRPPKKLAIGSTTSTRTTSSRVGRWLESFVRQVGAPPRPSRSGRRVERLRGGAPARRRRRRGRRRRGGADRAPGQVLGYRAPFGVAERRALLTHGSGRQRFEDRLGRPLAQRGVRRRAALGRRVMAARAVVVEQRLAIGGLRQRKREQNPRAARAKSRRRSRRRGSARRRRRGRVFALIRAREVHCS